MILWLVMLGLIGVLAGGILLLAFLPSKTLQDVERKVLKNRGEPPTP